MDAWGRFLGPKFAVLVFGFLASAVAIGDRSHDGRASQPNDDELGWVREWLEQSASDDAAKAELAADKIRQALAAAARTKDWPRYDRIQTTLEGAASRFNDRQKRLLGEAAKPLKLERLATAIRGAATNPKILSNLDEMRALVEKAVVGIGLLDREHRGAGPTSSMQQEAVRRLNAALAGTGRADLFFTNRFLETRIRIEMKDKSIYYVDVGVKNNRTTLRRFGGLTLLGDAEGLDEAWRRRFLGGANSYAGTLWLDSETPKKLIFEQEAGGPAPAATAKLAAEQWKRFPSTPEGETASVPEVGPKLLAVELSRK